VEEIMGTRLYVFLSLLLSLVAGCGGGSPYYGTPKSAPYESQASQSSYGTYGAPSGSGRAAGGATAPTSEVRPGAPMDTSHREAYRPDERPYQPERPGLGTEWGETRVSRVHDVSFVRADADRPFAIATLHYDDRAGIQALSQYHSGQEPAFRELPAGGGAITVSVRDEWGGPLDGFHVGDRNYVVGQSGQRYVLSLVNHTGHRFELVATVDGLDVINGQPGALDHRGYVLNPYATLDIEGFRQSHDAVAAFRFAAVHDSYAEQTGNARNVGVIGLAFFAERGDSFDAPTPRPNNGELYLRDTANPFPSTDPRFARPPMR
jgi:hypothetical protein